MKTRMTAVMLIALTGCPSASSDGDAGFETGPCIEGECFDGLECLSDLCVGPDSESGEDSSNPSGNPTSVTATNGNPTAGTASDSASGPDSGSTSGPDSDSNSDSNASNSNSDSNSNSNSNSDSNSDSDSDSDSDSTSTTGGDETTTGDDPTTSDSGPTCGNGDVDPGEQCDGNNLQGFDCAGLGLGGGTLGCDPVMCTFDTSMCSSTSTGTSG